ncbi:MAG: L-asparaginase 2, partial [bacterium]
MRTTLIAAAFGTALLAADVAAQTPRPTVLVLGTGGTIGSAGDYWGGNATRVAIDQLVKVPGIDSVATV